MFTTFSINYQIAELIENIVQETPAGDINGSNAVFFTSSMPRFIFVFLNGIYRKKDEDYTTVSNKITFEPDCIPLPGDKICVVYLKFTNV